MWDRTRDAVWAKFNYLLLNIQATAYWNSWLVCAHTRDTLNKHCGNTLQLSVYHTWLPVKDVHTLLLPPCNFFFKRAVHFKNTHHINIYSYNDDYTHTHTFDNCSFFSLIITTVNSYRKAMAEMQKLKGYFHSQPCSTFFWGPYDSQSSDSSVIEKSSFKKCQIKFKIYFED